VALSVVASGLSKLPLILAVQPHHYAHLIECHIDPVGMDLNSCDDGAEDRMQLLGIEILPSRPTKK
jgi:hypothetical protein